MRAVLERLREHRLYAKTSKCEFEAAEVVFLGFVLSADGVAIEPSRVGSVVD